MKLTAIIIIAILSTGCETIRVQGQGAGDAINTATYGAMCNMTTSLYTCIGVGIVKGWTEGTDDERHKIALEKQKKPKNRGFWCNLLGNC
jgi:hypothetical protein